MSVPIWKTVNAARVSAAKDHQAKATTTASMVPSPVAAMRTPRGRQVCGSGTVAGGRSESAGMDVGQQDAPGTDVEERVHQPLGARTRNHGANGDPALTMEWRDGRAL